MSRSQQIVAVHFIAALCAWGCAEEETFGPVDLAWVIEPPETATAGDRLDVSWTVTGGDLVPAAALVSCPVDQPECALRAEGGPGITTEAVSGTTDGAAYEEEIILAPGTWRHEIRATVVDGSQSRDLIEPSAGTTAASGFAILDAPRSVDVGQTFTVTIAGGGPEPGAVVEDVRFFACAEDPCGQVAAEGSVTPTSTTLVGVEAFEATLTLPEAGDFFVAATGSVDGTAYVEVVIVSAR